ncbi:hypothetical protein [Tenacibaculum sp. UWU-22]|uniref:hypothetical protein n=1 Tax=Tenacibaculum sp. UWU-22 TaxID=3234187 RepID=UPI0034DAF083
MQLNNIDKQIAKKLQNRKIQPSSSAWDRLSSQLDAHQNKKKKNWFFYIGYAAGFVLFLGLGIAYFFKSNHNNPTVEVVVKNEIDTLKTNNTKTKTLIYNEKKAVVKVEKRHKKKTIKKQPNKTTTPIIKSVVENPEEVVVKDTISNQSSTKEKLVADLPPQENENHNTSIKVNSQDLLFAVTHTPKEVKEYYARHKINQEDVLKTIKYELKKSNLNIDPNTILAEVEKSIDDDEFGKDFMQKLKLKISNIAVAIAERNK